MALDHQLTSCVVSRDNINLIYAQKKAACRSKKDSGTAPFTKLILILTNAAVVSFILFFKRDRLKEASDLRDLIQGEYINLNSIIDAAKNKNESTNNNNK